MKSMTGYAYEEIVTEDYTASIEIKSVNSRFLDLSINLPSFLSRIENRFKEMITANILRGKVDVYVKIKENNQAVKVEANVNAAQEYLNAISEIANKIGQKSENIPLGLIIQQEGVLSTQKDYDIEKYWKIFEPIFSTALNAFIRDREREGKNLEKDLIASLARIEVSEKTFIDWQPKMEQIFKDNILKRFNEMLGDNVDQQRVMQETAALLMKYTINEEIVRLGSHIKALKKEFAENSAPGRKIDFICQELNREINTIGSKNQIIEVGAAVIAAKDALENIREQARNVE